QPKARVQKQPTRTVKEQKSQMAPAIAPSAQVRGTAAPVRRERCGYLSDSHFEKSGLHDHFGGKLHARRAQSHTHVRILTKSPETAVKITRAASKQHPPNLGENRISKVPMQSWHRAPLNASAEAVAHDEVRAPAQLLHEARDVAKVVAVVGIPHDDELATRSRDPAHQGVAVSLGV